MQSEIKIYISKIYFRLFCIYFGPHRTTLITELIPVNVQVDKKEKYMNSSGRSEKKRMR